MLCRKNKVALVQKGGLKTASFCQTTQNGPILNFFEFKPREIQFNRGPFLWQKLLYFIPEAVQRGPFQKNRKMGICQSAQNGPILKIFNIFNLKSKLSGGHFYA